MKKLLNLIGTIGLSISISVPLLAMSKIEIVNNSIEDDSDSSESSSDISNNAIYNEIHDNGPIVRTINYSNYRHIWANWSSTIDYKDYSSQYFLVDYTNYANSFQEFSEKYPSITIETKGEAISDSTFGNAGVDRFGTLVYNTNNFIVDNIVYFVYLVNVNESRFWAYSINTKIGIGFKKRNTELYLNPFISGKLTSHGAFKRTLDFGLSVKRIIFNPRISN